MCPIGTAMGNPIAWPLFFVVAFFRFARLSACSGNSVGQRAGGAVSVLWSRFLHTYADSFACSVHMYADKYIVSASRSPPGLD